MTYIPYLETFFSRGTPVWPWPVINAEAGWWAPLNVFFSEYNVAYQRYELFLFLISYFLQQFTSH